MATASSPMPCQNPDSVQKERPCLPNRACRFRTNQIKATKRLSLPALFFQGEVDGVNPPPVSESDAEKFTGPFERTLLPGIGHFPTREVPDVVAEGLIMHLSG
jgi:pimeloyl-ACP methyl ester carboxylesterase